MAHLAYRFSMLGFFLGIALLLQSSDAFAVQVANKSELKIAVAIIRVDGERKTPLYIKIIQPKTEIEHTPEQAGPYLVSVKVFETDQELRIENVEAADRIQFKKGKLKRVKKKA